MSEEYIVKTENYEGPFDLLLFLVKKQELEIRELSLSEILREYLRILALKERINIDREADFLEVAASLIYLKSKALLPVQKADEEGEDLPREELSLVEQLQHFEVITKVRELLVERIREEGRRFPVRLPLEEEPEVEVYPVSLFLLAKSFFQLLRDQEEEAPYRPTQRKAELVQLVKELNDLVKRTSCLDFTEHFLAINETELAFFTFFALLELVRKHKVVALQESCFGKILLFPAGALRKSEENRAR